LSNNTYIIPRDAILNHRSIATPAQRLPCIGISKPDHTNSLSQPTCSTPCTWPVCCTSQLSSRCTASPGTNRF
jgi:hypothetical protein